MFSKSWVTWWCGANPQALVMLLTVSRLGLEAKQTLETHLFWSQQKLTAENDGRGIEEDLFWALKIRIRRGKTISFEMKCLPGSCTGSDSASDRRPSGCIPAQRAYGQCVWGSSTLRSPHYQVKLLAKTLQMINLANWKQLATVCSLFESVKRLVKASRSSVARSFTIRMLSQSRYWMNKTNNGII